MNIYNFLIKFADFLEFYSISYGKPYAKNTAYKDISRKVAKLWSMQIDFKPLISDDNKRSYILLKQT